MLKKSEWRLFSIIVLVALFVLTACQPIQPQAAQPALSTTDAQIQNAMSAAPPAIAQDATILAWPTEEGGDMVVLREGSNDWICIADWPASPGNDPSCNDAVWTAWNDAYAKGEEPEITAPGIAYMLQGGSDPSNTDPMAMEPAPGEDWVNTPPHIMILSPGGFDAADFATEPKQDEPYIMWDGTPYAHLMVPVTPMAKDAMGDADAVMQNTLSSAPAGIALNATIMGYPEKEGDPMVVLKEGTNGWICYPDRTVSPGNDPSCNNAHLEAAFGAFPNTVVTKPGLSYMLQGGSDESNSDPTASGPAPGEDWVTTPPHIMLMVPGGLDASQFTTDHTSGYPYIMFDDSPIEHLMIPVSTSEMDMSK
jgi:hypothetical protein